MYDYFRAAARPNVPLHGSERKEDSEDEGRGIADQDAAVLLQSENPRSSDPIQRLVAFLDRDGEEAALRADRTNPASHDDLPEAGLGASSSTTTRPAQTVYTAQVGKRVWGCLPFIFKPQATDIGVRCIGSVLALSSQASDASDLLKTDTGQSQVDGLKAVPRRSHDEDGEAVPSTPIQRSRTWTSNAPSHLPLNLEDPAEGTEQAARDLGAEVKRLKSEVAQVQSLVQELRHATLQTRRTPQAEPRSSPSRTGNQALRGGLSMRDNGYVDRFSERASGAAADARTLDHQRVLDFVRRVDSLVWLKRDPDENVDGTRSAATSDARRDEAIFASENLDYLERRIAVWEEVVRGKEKRV